MKNQRGSMKFFLITTASLFGIALIAVIVTWILIQKTDTTAPTIIKSETVSISE